MTTDDLKAIITHYGTDAQKTKAIEELSELIKAICKEDKDNLIEEIADVKIMIEQLIIIYGIKDADILRNMEFKINRTLQRMEKEKMRYTNSFAGKKQMVRDFAEVYKRIEWSDISDIELKKYRNKEGNSEEFVLLTWTNGAISTANNNINSITATARNVARMLDGGIYENIDRYKEIMESPDWVEVAG